MRLLAALPAAAEVTVEANPETVTPELAALLRGAGVDRVSLGAQTFQPRLLETLERRATPDDVRRAPCTLFVLPDSTTSRSTSSTASPGQSADDLERDLEAALALEPEHLSCYELEAKPGTRFTHRHGDELARQADALEGYFERVVEALTAAGYRWYETANFCIAPERRGRAGPALAAQPRLLARPRLPRRSASARSPRWPGSAGETRRPRGATPTRWRRSAPAALRSSI